MLKLQGGSSKAEMLESYFLWGVDMLGLGGCIRIEPASVVLLVVNAAEEGCISRRLLVVAEDCFSPLWEVQGQHLAVVEWAQSSGALVWGLVLAEMVHN